MLIEEIDFEDFANYLLNTYGNIKLNLNNFNMIADTYCGLTYGSTPKDNTNEELIETLIALGFIVEDKNSNELNKRYRLTKS